MVVDISVSATLASTVLRGLLLVLRPKSVFATETCEANKRSMKTPKTPQMAASVCVRV